MTPLERLMQEAIPTRPERAVHSVWTQEEQDRHWADLAEALGVPVAKRPEHPAPDAKADADEAAA